MGVSAGGERAAGGDVGCGGASGATGSRKVASPNPRVSVAPPGAVSFGKALGLVGVGSGFPAALLPGFALCLRVAPSAACPSVTRRSQCHHCHSPGVGRGLRWAQEGCGTAAGLCHAEPCIDSFHPWGEEV